MDIELDFPVLSEPSCAPASLNVHHVSVEVRLSCLLVTLTCSIHVGHVEKDTFYLFCLLTHQTFKQSVFTGILLVHILSECFLVCGY